MRLTEEKHLTDAELRALLDGTLSESDLERVCGHIADCGECAERLAASPVRKAPAGFAGLTSELALTKREEKRVYLFRCVKVGIASAAAIALVFTGILDKLPFTDSRDARITAPPQVTIPAPEPSEPGKDRGYLGETLDNIKKLIDLNKETDDD